MNVRVAACQQNLQEPLSQSTIAELQSFQPDFVCLPEHYPLAAEIRNLQEAADRFSERKQYLNDVSHSLQTIVVGGTLTEPTADGYYNTCYVFDRGREVGSYRKVNPTSREQSAGTLRGSEFKIFELAGLRVGVLICADVLFQESFEQLAALQCQLTFVPTASPHRPGESTEEKYQRDRSIFLEGAQKMGCPIIKTCGVGTTFGHPIQGRSLITTTDDILIRAEPHQEQTSLILKAELDLR
ncbi:carbon-nitrogen hydrolase family protein [bacterium]|nr:carbon-nitrogen hydrolase family protein [bacterium]